MRRIPPAHTPIPLGALLRRTGDDRGAQGALAALLAERYDGADVLLVGSGTQALALAIRALAGDGGEVALPGWGCYDLASAAVGAGVGVRLYDLDPATLQPRPESLARVAAGAAAGVLVSFFGIPVDPALVPDASGTRWIHDAAQAHGMRALAPSLDERAEATVLSFGRGKGWTGLGGGALLLRGEEARRAVRGLPLAPAPGGAGARRFKGAAQWLLGRPSLYALPAHLPGLGLGETRYHPPEPPHALPAGSAGVLLAGRAEADREAEHRRGFADALRQTLADAGAGAPVEAIRVDEGAAPGYLRFPVLDRGRADRRGGARLGILASYPRTLDTLPALKPFLRSADPLPGCTRLAHELLTLPTHSRMSARDRLRVRRWCTPR